MTIEEAIARRSDVVDELNRLGEAGQTDNALIEEAETLNKVING